MEKADESILNETLDDTIDDNLKTEPRSKSPSPQKDNLLLKLMQKHKRKLTFTSGTNNDQNDESTSSTQLITDESSAKNICEKSDMMKSPTSSTNLLAELFQKRQAKMASKSPSKSPLKSPQKSPTILTPLEDNASQADWSSTIAKCLQLIKLPGKENLASPSELEKNREKTTATLTAQTTHQMRSNAKTFKLKLPNEKYNEEKSRSFEANLKQSNNDLTQQQRELTVRVESMDDEINKLYHANHRFQV